MKSIVLEGQVSQAPCERCQRFVPSRFAYGPVDHLLRHSALRNASEVLRRLLVMADADGLTFGSRVMGPAGVSARWLICRAAGRLALFR